MFGIKRLKTQIEELRKEVAQIAENQRYYEPSLTIPHRYYPNPSTPSNGYGLFSFGNYPLSQHIPPTAKLLSARNILDRFDELYEALNLERKTIPGTETTTKLQKKVKDAHQ